MTKPRIFYRLPTEEDIDEVRSVLAYLEGEDVDDPEELLDDLPMYLEMILALQQELDELKATTNKL